MGEKNYSPINLMLSLIIEELLNQMREKNLKINRLFVLAIFLLGAITTNISAQDVPANLQAALFKKIFSFDKTLTGGAEVAVIGSSSEGIVSAFKAAGINAKSSDNLAGANVVYVMPGAPSPKDQTGAKGILSISGDASYAESGKVAIGLGIEGGKPQIIIHMGQLKAEKHEFSPELLKIAKVIQ